MSQDIIPDEPPPPPKPRRQWEARELYDAVCVVFERRGETPARWLDLDAKGREAFEAIARLVNEG